MSEAGLPVHSREVAGGPPLLTVEISLPDVEELHKLVQEGLEKGFLNYDEIVSGIEEVELTKEQVEDFYTYLIDHGIELHEGETHKHPPHEQPSLAEGEKTPPKLDLTVEPSLDSLRLYLREIGKVPLLTADREVYLAKRIEREELPRPRAVVSRPDPGGIARAHSRRREVRLPQGLQILDLRDLVDPPGGDPRDCRQGADDPHPGAHGREAQQGRPHRAAADPAPRPRAAPRRDRRGAGHDDRRGARDPADGAAPDFAGEADRRGGGVRTRRLRPGRLGRVSLRHRAGDLAAVGHRECTGVAAGPGAEGDRAALRSERRASVHARGGRPRLRRHARADPPDREQHAEEARVAT